MNNTSMEVFHQVFLSSDDQNRELTSSTNESNRLDNALLQTLQNRLFRQLGDWLAFIEARSQGNITISLSVFDRLFLLEMIVSFSCQQDFPGLVHFALIDRSRGRICTPALFTEDYRNYLASRANSSDLDNIKERKVGLSAMNYSMQIIHFRSLHLN